MFDTGSSVFGNFLFFHFIFYSTAERFTDIFDTGSSVFGNFLFFILFFTLPLSALQISF